MKSVKIGGKECQIERFRGLKAILAVAALTRLTRDVPDIFADADKQFRRRNSLVITEAMSKLPRWQGFTKEDFDQAEAQTGRREIELPEAMDQQQMILAALPQLLEQARKEVVRLLAILIISNDELREADKADQVEPALDKYKEQLLYEAELDELADLALATQEVLTDQLGDRSQRLGKLAASLVSAFRSQTRTSTETADLAEMIAQAQASTEKTSPAESPTSSTPSETPTDGAEKQLSTVSPG